MILFEMCGAYGYTMASEYNLRGMPHEVFLPSARRCEPAPP